MVEEGKETRMGHVVRISKQRNHRYPKMITSISLWDECNNDEYNIDLSPRLFLTSDWYLSDIWIVTQCEWRGWVP